MPHDVDESQLDAMAARVAAVVTEEQAARVDKPLETVTPDFVAKCAGFAEKGDDSALGAVQRKICLCTRDEDVVPVGWPVLGTDACPPGGSFSG